MRYTIETSKLTARNPLPFFRVNLELDPSAESDPIPSEQQEYSFKINTKDSHLPIWLQYDLQNHNLLAVILTEHEAYHLLKRFNDRVYLIFKKWLGDNETYHLLVKSGNEIQEFDICMRNVYKTLSVHHHRGGVTGFNLKDKNGELVLSEDVITPFRAFIESSSVIKKFGSSANLNHVKMLSCSKDSTNPKNKKLWMNIASRLILEGPSLKWLPQLPQNLQDIALFYFVNSFIYIYKRNISDIDAFITNTIHNEYSPSQLYYYPHYRLDEIERNLNSLRWLCQQGNQKAAQVLAAIHYAGLHEFNNQLIAQLDAKVDAIAQLDAEVDSMISRLLFNNPGHTPKQPKLFCSHEEYRKITQDPTLFPEKVVRDFYLLTLYKQDRSNLKPRNDVLAQIEINKAIFLTQPFYSEDILLSCIQLNEQQSIEALIGIKNIFHCLIELGRTRLASHLIDKFPEELLKAKDEAGRNILHKLIESISINGICGSAFIMTMVESIGTHVPSLLIDPDNSGRTPFDDFKQLQQSFNAGEFTAKLFADLESRLSQYPVELPKTLGLR